jgi:hypothetical protein
MWWEGAKFRLHWGCIVKNLLSISRAFVNRFWKPNILNFVFNYVENFDLPTIVDLISNNYIYGDFIEKKRSIWT